MSEPYTDKEFEKVKLNHRGSPVPHPSFCICDSCKIGSLIATIELQKSDKALGAALVRRVQELKAELEARMDVYVACRRDRKKAEEENAKLKEQVKNWKDAVHDYSVALQEKEK